MTRLFVKYLAIYNNGNLPKSITNYPKYVQYFANNKKPIRKAQRLLFFCQSDEILPHLVTLNTSHDDDDCFVPNNGNNKLDNLFRKQLQHGSVAEV